MTSPATRSLQITRQYDFSMERVFDAWLAPDKIRRFLFATPTGTIVRVDIDARVGGTFVITDRRDGEDVEHTGQYLEIDRPRRLVFTFGVPKYSKEFTRVALDLKPTATGCELTLTHEGVLPEWLEKSREGWGMILEALAMHLSQ